MKLFLFHILRYFIFTFLLVLGISWFAGPYTDPFYLRFTTPKKGSLIIGTSRAAQSIVPEVITSLLQAKQIESDLYNFSFTVKSSPFGEPYLNSIKKKLAIDLDSESKSIFIVAVDPWSVSTMFMDSLKSNPFQEKNFAPNNMSWMAMNPNPEYLFKNLDNRLLMIVRYFNHSGHPELKRDGSLAVDRTFVSKSQISIIIDDRIREYESYSRKYKFSELRFEYLKKTIIYLKDRGTVFLVRIPIDPGLLKIENDFNPKFDESIQSLAQEFSIPYLNYSNLSGTFETTDGNHLTRSEAIRFSNLLGQDLKMVLLRR